MYNINFYKDRKGKEPVKDYIISLKIKNTKDSLIKLQKIQDYLKVLNNEYVNINNSKSLDDAIKNKERYVSADLRKAKLEVYSLENKILFL